MKIDRSKLKKSSTDVPADCRTLIEKLKTCQEDQLLAEIRNVKTWTFGKCELYHWSDVLDIFDDVLERSCRKEADKKWTLACDLQGNEKLKKLLLDVLRFTALLIEHSFSRHLYNSMEHLTTLLSACDMTIVLGVLNLLYVFSKRSNFITRLYPEKKQALVVRLTHLAESWGGKENGFGLAECCKNIPLSNFPASATTLHFEFYTESKEEKERSGKKNVTNIVQHIHMDNVDESEKLPSEIMEELLECFNIPANKQTLLYTHIRLAHLFSKYDARVQCVQARLQAIAILVYSNSIQENLNIILYPGLIEELVDIVELKEDGLVDIKAAALRTLTSIIHLERNPKLNSIIDATGASSYHGFLPVLVRTCIQHMIDRELSPFPQQYATALFSFLYHLASYENGVEALVSCGMMEALLKVINWYAEGQDHITFVTRAVRVIDLITNLDMAAFQAHGGLQAFINRLEHEVSICRKEQPFVIKPRNRELSLDMVPDSPPTLSLMETEGSSNEATDGSSSKSTDVNQGASTSSGATHATDPENSGAKPGIQCFPQRAALLKSMLNFLKKAIPDTAFAESIRHLMDGSLPRSLKHIISNAEYYGPSLFLLATDVVTVYVFQEPSLLSSLQDNGLTDVVLNALLIKDVPATREVLASLPNMFSALCLNSRGLQAFVDCDPFERLLKVLLSPDYLPAMRRRRSSDQFGDTASNLGNAMDELMRHQPTLRTHATKAIIKLLEKVCEMGQDSKYICQKQQAKVEANISLSVRSPQPADGGSSDEEEEEEELASQASQTAAPKPNDTLLLESMQATETQEKQAIPLMDYVLNVMRFVEAILSNNSTDDHCREFVSHSGLIPLLKVLGLPNLPIDYPASPACQAVATVCKAILTLSREPQVLRQGLLQLNEVLTSLEPLHKHLESPGGSVLLRELAGVSCSVDPTLSPQATPLLHALSAAHAYIMMFVHVCRLGQNDIRTISVSHWGSELGLKVLAGLSQLYTSLVWESTVLLALCSEDILPQGCEFGRADMEKILPKDMKLDKDSKEDESLSRSLGETGSNGVSAAMESLTTSENPETPMEVSEPSTSDKDPKKSKLSPLLQAQIKQLKPLLSVSSRLGRSLAELFGLLVKLCVGMPLRHRRSHQPPPTPTTPTPAAQAVAKALTKLLANGLSWSPPSYAPVPKLRLTFLVCSVGFTSPMLFDEKKQPYHLMLQRFVSSGGQNSLFQAFSWALSMDGKVPLSDGIEHPELPDGSGEFLDAWLMLVEKMVNPKAILESIHTLPLKSSQPGFTSFSPVLYLISTQKAAFNAVMNLWGKKPLKIYGSRMSESILAILCHIIKGETIIKENLAKEKEEKPETSTGGLTTAAPASTLAPPSLNSRRLIPDSDLCTPTNIQQLMDMGFTREHCTEALMHSVSLEQATEYILTHPHPATAPVGGGTTANVATSSGTSTGGGLLDEEDQMMRAIAMSLGEDVVMSTDKKDEEDEKKTEDAGEAEKQEDEDPLDKSVLDTFTDSILPGCMSLLDTLPETVYRVCDLLVVVTQRNGDQWRNNMLKSLVKEVYELGDDLSRHMGADESNSDNTDKSTSNAAKFATRLHLLTLLFEEMMMPSAKAIEEAKLIHLLIQVLHSGQEYLSNTKDPPTPKWMAPLLLLLDLFQKVSVTSLRKSKAAELTSGSHSWKWFDDGSGRWCKYSQSNNKTIDDAYQNGDINIRFQAGRRRYTVQFGAMVQINEETGNRRPIMLSLPSPDEKQNKTKDESKDNKTDKDEGKTEVKMETEVTEEKPSTSTANDKKIVGGLSDDLIVTVIRSVVSLISVPVDPDTLHASLRLTLRLTREHKYAVIFAELGGPKLLLNLTQESAFQGFISLVTLLFRHILEEPTSLKYCMEKVMRCACAGIGSSVSGVTQGSIGSKEMHYVLRVLGPAACRNENCFVEVARNTLQIALPPPAKIVRDEDEVRYTGPNAPQILKCSPSKQVAVLVSQTTKDVVYDLLNALAVKYAWNQEDSTTASCEVRPAQTLAEAIQDVVNELNDQRQVEGTGEDETTKEQKEAKTAEDARKKRPLLPKSSILRLLSEFIKSYGNCSQLITQYNYHVGQTELVMEDCSVLAFILDQLLPQCQQTGDKDCPALSRVFIASLASCNHSPEAQNSLVSEIKSALQRALCLPESSEKHSRLQALTAIISTMIESCPSPGNIPNQVFKGQQAIMNNMVKILIKRGLVSDLARVPHCLDLSSPYMANTINSALKPLETLSRSVNQSMQNNLVKPKNNTSTLAVGSTQTVDESTANMGVQAVPSEISTAVASQTASTEDSVAIEDVTEDPLAQEDLEETDIHNTVEPELDSLTQAEAELEQVLDEILRSGNEAEDEVIEEISMITDDEPPAAAQNEENPDVMINVEIMTEDDELEDHHDSQMVTQDISDGEDETIEHERDIHEEDHSSASDDDDNDDDDDRDNDDDDEHDHDDDDEDEEEEDDEGSDMEADDDDYQDVDNSVAPGLDDDFLIHMDDMFPSGTGLGNGNGNQHIIFNDNTQLRTYQLPSLMHDADNGNEAAVPSLPPAPSNVPSAHPLLIRNADAASMMSVARVHRGNRQRGSYRFNANTQTLHVNLPSGTTRQPNPPVILQRLLGPTTAADILQLTNTLTTQSSGPTHTRVVLANDDRCIISRPEEDIFDELFQDPYPESGAAGTGVLSCIPSTLTRWTEETKVLDADSVHDCVNVLKPGIIEHLVKHRDDELSERREVRHKTAEEEAAKKEKEKQEKQNDVNAPASEASSTIISRGETSGSTVDIAGGGVSTITGVTHPPAITSTPRPPVSAVDNTGTQISVSEAVAAVERLASVVVEEVLASPIPTTAVTMSVQTPAVSSITGTFTTPVTTTTTVSSDTTQSSVPRTIDNFVTPLMLQGPPVIMPAAPRRNEAPTGNQTNLAYLLSFDDDAPPNSHAEDSLLGDNSASPALASSTAAASSSTSTEQLGLTSITGTAGRPIPSSTIHSTTNIPSSGTSSSDPNLPDGVDPSFLAALPENIRQEVIAEQLRLQRIQQRAQQQAQAAESTGTMEVNPEFLAALPPAIQEEVLAQQRAEQARAAAQTQSQTNPDTPIDPAGFFATLPSQLRQQVLSDMDESMIAVLPTDLAAEAQELRRELEERHRRLMQERLFAQAGAASLSAILRHTGLAGRLGTRYAIRAAPRGGNQWAWGSGRMSQQNSANANNMKVKGRHLLDHESLTCLLVLLFLDEPKLNTNRLHRVLRNLCYHGPTRAWVIRALLSILQKTSDCKMDNDEKGKTPEKNKLKKLSAMQTDSPSVSRSERNQISWLNISQEAALGCRANVFQIQRTGKKHTNSSNAFVSIHSQAAPVVCRHVLDTLISLAKIFPGQFLPSSSANNSRLKELQKCDEEKDSESKSKQSGSGGSGGAVSPRLSRSEKGDKSDSKSETDFWDLLVRLDSACGKRGKGMPRTHSNSCSEVEVLSTSYNTSPIGQLMAFLSHSVIRRSQLLTDRLLRLLGLVSIGLPESARNRSSGAITMTTVSTAATAIATSSATVTTTASSSGPAVSAPLPTEKKTETGESSKDKDIGIKEDDDVPILETELQLAVQVLTSKSCSEEGLEDATNLLLQLSWATPATRNSVLQLLLQGARELGMTVSTHIWSLLSELQHMNSKLKDEGADEDRDAEPLSSQPAKGVLVDRFAPSNNIIVAAPAKFKTGRELQLPSMSQLTSKVSSQQFFLRVLKVIIQLREAARIAAKNSQKQGTRDRLSMAEAMAALEAQDDGGMEGFSLQTSQSASISTNSSSTDTTTPPTTATQPAEQNTETPMDVDQAGPSQDKNKEKKVEEKVCVLPRLSEQLQLEDLWHMLGDCLTELAKTPDQHAVLILQPAVEAFFIVHAGEKDLKPTDTSAPKREDQMAHLNLEMAPPSPSPALPAEDTLLLSRENSVASVSSIIHLPPDTQKFLKFAETHRTVLNQILRQSTTPLAEGPFSVLVDHTRILDFDVKRRYFRQELEQHDEGLRREDLPVHVRREHVFEDSFRELFRRTPEEWKQRFYIVFEGEEGQDAGGLLREWYLIISREIFNPNYALFRTSPGDRVTYTINPSSHCNSNHLSYFKFVGRIIAKAVYDNKLLECYFTRSFYKHLLGLAVKYTDMESEDYSFYQGLVFLIDNSVHDLGYELTFNTEIQEFGVTESRDLKPNGRNIPVTDENKREYVKLVCQMRMTADIRKQLNAFLEGFYDIIPKKLVSIFTEQEIELLISGLPTIDIDDLKSNSEYHKYQATSLQIQWFWRALRSFDQAERANFLQFVTGTSKVPLQGFAFLEGMNGIQKFQIHRDDRSTDRLPTAHTCFNQLDLPAYETYDKLRHMLLLAVMECSEGFGLA
ncbi:hypothetical protein SNE40_015469 [Patella caerulea]|uniref:HECT-type E3 ubiquitin transferase n=1 Tax=Patella caerulea TaxID=87958 RepID=A0AAN8JL69_PATCE